MNITEANDTVVVLQALGVTPHRGAPPTPERVEHAIARLAARASKALALTIQVGPMAEMRNDCEAALDESASFEAEVKRLRSRIAAARSIIDYARGWGSVDQPVYSDLDRALAALDGEAGA